MGKYQYSYKTYSILVNITWSMLVLLYPDMWKQTLQQCDVTAVSGQLTL